MLTTSPIDQVIKLLTHRPGMNYELPGVNSHNTLTEFREALQAAAVSITRATLANGQWEVVLLLSEPPDTSKQFVLLQVE